MTSGISYFLSNNSIMTDESSGFYLWRWPLVITIIFWLLQISSWIREFLEQFWNSFIETTDCFLAARIFKTISSHKSLKYKHVSNIWQYVRNGEYILWSQSIHTQHFQQRKVYGSITIHITCSPSLVFEVLYSDFQTLPYMSAWQSETFKTISSKNSLLLLC